MRELLKPLAHAAAPIERAIKELEALAAETTSLTPDQKPKYDIWLRPPGALFPDQSFRDTCSRCGNCVDVCPADCIKISVSGHKGNGAPYIDANEMPCVVCEGLQCMHDCPSGALQPIPLVDIDMGTAIWNYETCLRKRDEHCRICVDVCPVGTVAIELVANTIYVHEDGCIGCGVCQQQCPTSPKSIAVLPRKVREETT